MGNSGSAHNIHSDRSFIDRNSSHFPTHHFQHLSHSSHRQYQLNRSGFRSSPVTPQRSLNTEWRRSYPTANINKESKVQVEIPFKVLPELDKKLHLRATTNGAILNSGGTISGRKVNENPSGVPNALSQRSKTFIYESSKDLGVSALNGNKSGVHPEFTRSQTLLYIKANKNKDTNINNNDSNLSRMQRHTFSEPEHINKLNSQSTVNKNVVEPTTKPSTNRNRYTKKRRAPEAPPTTVTLSTPTAKSNSQNITADHVKPIHFAKNSERLSKSTKPTIATTTTTKIAQNQSGTFQRGHEKRNSVNGNNLQSISNECPKFAYRREKSSDAIMLKSRNSEKLETCAKTSTNNIQANYNNIQSQATSQNPPAANIQKDNSNKVIVSVPANKTQRTFYFGMERNDANQSTDIADEKHPYDDSDVMPNILNYDIEYKTSPSSEENLNDNGLLVHIRPTLPRRQVDTPTFSPVLAWRALLEEQDRLEKSKIVNNVKAQTSVWNMNATPETPIQPNRTSQIRQVSKSNNVLTAWTPEQDLNDDNDDRVNGLSTDDSSSDEYRSKCDADNFLFYGSKAKKPGQDAVAPIHTFSLSLPRDAHTRSMDILNEGDICIYKSLQKPKADHYVKNNINPSTRNIQHDNVGVSKIESSSNWVLHHKNVSAMDAHTKSLEYGDKKQRLLSIEPQSIKYLTGGKHVMYLPGNNDKSKSNQLRTNPPEPQVDIEPKVRTARHFKNRQRNMPQNLQDKTPIFPIKSITEQSPKLDDDKPFHQRFSFNNPVRLLEKKLYTEKSVKASKNQMTLDGELEALKKVEEDFQRNRANEKENIQHQLRLHFGNDNSDHYEQYHSLPLAPVLNRFSDINDTNNKLFGRDDPDGCVSNVPFVAHESDDHKKNFAANNNLLS